MKRNKENVLIIDVKIKWIIYFLLLAIYIINILQYFSLSLHFNVFAHPLLSSIEPKMLFLILFCFNLPFDRFEYCSVVIIVVGAAISKCRKHEEQRKKTQNINMYV